MQNIAKSLCSFMQNYANGYANLCKTYANLCKAKCAKVKKMTRKIPYLRLAQARVD
jgi:hypothetical protein